MKLYELFEGTMKGKFLKPTSKTAFAQLEKMKQIQNPNDMQKQTIANLEKQAKSLLDTEMSAAEKDFLQKNLGSDWWELGKKLYPITQEGNEWVVKSTAAEWKEEKSWKYDYKFQALEQVELLMKYKNHDRNKGVGNSERDLEKWSEKFGHKNEA